MASLLAASRQYLAAANGLHARTEPVRLSAAAFARLVCALWQSNPPILIRRATRRNFKRTSHRPPRAAKSELSSLLVVGGRGQETSGVGYKAGKSDTPSPSCTSAVPCYCVARTRPVRKIE